MKDKEALISCLGLTQKGLRNKTDRPNLLPDLLEPIADFPKDVMYFIYLRYTLCYKIEEINKLLKLPYSIHDIEQIIADKYDIVIE